MGRKKKRKVHSPNSLTSEWLGLRTFTAEDPGSIPGWGTKIPTPADICILKNSWIKDIHGVHTSPLSTLPFSWPAPKSRPKPSIQFSNNWHYPSFYCVPDTVLPTFLNYDFSFLYNSKNPHFVDKETKEERSYLAMRNKTGPGLRLRQGDKAQSTHCPSWLVPVPLKVGSWGWHWCPLLCCRNPSGGTTTLAELPCKTHFSIHELHADMSTSHDPDPALDTHDIAWLKKKRPIKSRSFRSSEGWEADQWAKNTASG